MGWLSPEASKAVEDARFRDTLWRPTLSRTSTKLIVEHAHHNRRGQRKETARVMLQDLGWQWDSNRRRFHAYLNAENLRAVLSAWTDHKHHPRTLHLNLSSGVREYRDQLRDQALPADHSRGKSKLFKS